MVESERGAVRPRLVVATGNAGKVREIEALLTDLPFEVSSLAGLPPVDFPEEGGDYAENAATKARVAAQTLGLPCVADDSGLEVDALGGAPGVYSARYGAPELDDAGRVAHLLAEIERSGASERSARFVCIAAFATPDGRVATRRGVCEGRIIAAPRGEGGFGYDPVFQPEGYDVSMAELPASTKDTISHRGRAFAELRTVIVDLLEPGAA